MVTVEVFGKLPSGVSVQSLKKLAEIGQKVIGSRDRTGLSVSIVSDAAIRRLNRQYRGLDKVTDVLSFGYGEARDFFGPADGQRADLGDIVISGPQVRRQAVAIGRPVDQEFSLLFVHGLLHLLGFDHGTAAQEARMFGLQQEVLMRAGIF